MKQLLSLQGDLEKLRQELLVFHEVVNETVNRKSLSPELHKESASVLALEHALSNSLPIESIANKLKEATNESLANAVIQGFPAQSLKHGTLTIPELRTRFAVVRNEVRKVALAPQGVPVFVGQLFGTALASISYSPTGNVKGDGIEEILARVDYYLENNRLKEAVNELSQVKGYSGEVLLKDWKELARQRLIADQAVLILRADVALKHNSYA